MKNLYQRLSKENLEKFNENAKDYPTTKELLEETLKTNFTWGTLRLTDALSIYNFIDIFKPFDLNTFTNLFDNE